VLVEKIIQRSEHLPGAWHTDGTTGYDALADIERVLIDPAGRDRLDALETTLRGAPEPLDWSVLTHETKRGIADGILRAEVLRLTRLAPDGLVGADDAIAELLACFPVYRSYLPTGVEQLTEAARLAADHRPDLQPALDVLVPLLADRGEPMAVRFQQTSGAVMAKGVEDTAFYRYTRLTSLTEVGGDPSEFSVTPAAFHRRQAARLARMPAGMTALSTHDTKRGEDARARIDVLAEVPERWTELIEGLRARAPLGDGPLENLLWQAVIGAWPASRERLHTYAEKAAREAGTSTTWTDPDVEFETRLHALIDGVFDDAWIHAAVEDFVAGVRSAGWSNSLAAKLLQLSGPGVPDVYQGSELWETSLVDPDNRRAVDFDQRRRMLAAIDSGEQPPIDETGAAKLLLTSRCLRLRRDRPDLFTRYVPLEVIGDAADHLIAVDRGGAIVLATRLPVGLASRGGWQDTVVVLPGHPLTDVFTSRPVPGGLRSVAEVLPDYPVALLTPSGADQA
jgi:(1->4)-alpha-D-glucan 1-alpha-D-glucosylmutase